MELTKEQIEKIEEMYECDISELDNFDIATFLASENDTLPDFIHNIGRYFDPDSISIVTKTRAPEVESATYTIKEESNEKTIQTYNKYIETQFKIMQAMMDIDGSLYKSIEGDCIIYATAEVDGFNVKFNYRINKTDTGIEIIPTTNIKVNLV